MHKELLSPFGFPMNSDFDNRSIPAGKLWTNDTRSRASASSSLLRAPGYTTSDISETGKGLWGWDDRTHPLRWPLAEVWCIRIFLEATNCRTFSTLSFISCWLLGLSCTPLSFSPAVKIEKIHYREQYVQHFTATKHLGRSLIWKLKSSLNTQVRWILVSVIWVGKRKMQSLPEGLSMHSGPVKWLCVHLSVQRTSIVCQASLWAPEHSDPGTHSPFPRRVYFCKDSRKQPSQQANAPRNFRGW